jgi:hypothetical protein
LFIYYIALDYICDYINTQIFICKNINFNFETNDSNVIFILLQRRFDASCIIFKLKIRIILGLALII